MRRSEHRWLLASVVAYAVGLIVLGWLVHPVGAFGFESDQYAERAERLLYGELGGDRFHPFLYPEVVAVVTLLVGDAFATGKAISSLAAGWLLYACYRLIRDAFGPRPAGWATALLAANGLVVVHGVLVNPDMMAAASFTTSLWLYRDAGSRGSGLFAAGVLLGLTVAARLNFLVMIPAMVALSALVQVGGIARRMRQALLMLAGSIVGYLPNALPTWIAFGTPITGDSWRNMAYKLSGFEPTVIYDPPYQSLFELLRVDGMRLLELGIQDFVATWTEQLGACVAGDLSVWPTAFVMTLLFGIACCFYVCTQPWQKSLVTMSLLVVFTGTLALTFRPQLRLLVPMAALVLMPITAMLFTIAARRPLWAHTACALLLAATATSVVPDVQRLIDAQPLGEIAAARELVAKEGPLITIASFYPLLASNVDAATVYVPFLANGWSDPEAIFDRVEQALSKRPADYLILGPKSVRGVATEELRRHVREGVRVVSCDEEVLVLRLPRDRVAWLQRAAAEIGADRRLRLSVETTGLEGILSAGFTVHPPGGAPFLIPLPRVSDRLFEETVPIAADSRGEWVLVPSCVFVSGVSQQAEPITVTLP